MSHHLTHPTLSSLTATATATLTQALTSPRAIDATPQQLEYVLAQAMAKAFADMGLKTTDRHDEITYLVQNMPAEVTRNLPNIKLDEIPIAINRGILRQYGDFYGLNVATFMHFLMQHYQSRQRAEAVKAMLAITEAAIALAPPSPAQLHQLRINRITTAFNQYKAKGFYNDYGSLVFDCINAMGKIPFNEDKEAQILQLARLNMINRYSRISVYPDERASLRATLNQIMHGEAPNLILTEAKRIALFELFDNLIEMGVKIEEFILGE